jgi:glucokinase
VSATNPAEYAIGIDLGATRIKAVAVRQMGELLDSKYAPTGDAGQGWKSSVPQLVDAFEKALGAAAMVGISAPGLARRDHRAIAWMRGRLDGVEGYDWTAALGRRRLVPVLNDAHAALLGEAWLGAARGQRDAVLLTLGTGVGGAILCDGRLLEGHLGRAGHLGHISLDPNGPPDIVNTPGSLEDLIGQHSLASRTGGRFSSTRELVAAYRGGDIQAGRVWLASVRALAAAIASIVNVVDPAIVVIGGGIAGAGDALFGPLGKEMERFEWRPSGAGVPIVAAQLGELAGAFGAAKFALDHAKELQ